MTSGRLMRSTGQTPMTLLCVLVLSISVFAMHAFDCRAAAAVAGQSHQSMVDLAEGTSQTLADDSRRVVAAVSSVIPLTSSAPAMSSDIAMDMSMMCLALLVITLFALAKLLQRPSADFVLWSLPRPGPTRFLNRVSDPPDLFDLSILRC